VNIDHVATIRNARGGEHPDPVRAALVAASAGADGITAHLREDRRHMTDRDIIRLTKDIDLPLNLEMAATDEMLDIALRHEPHAVCIVPEKRRERTTEGGLEVVSAYNHLEPFVRQLSRAGIKVSLFIEPTVEQVDASVALGAQVVELHTGAYCDAEHERERAEFERIVLAAAHAEAAGIECHAGHGLNFDTVVPVAAIPTIQELNIGHFLIGEAIFNGLERTIKRMRTLMDKARAASVG
tara:strand:- start:42 stop:761 length:720 start_codon:yes stop_codon:yes gene_type:complete